MALNWADLAVKLIENDPEFVIENAIFLHRCMEAICSHGNISESRREDSQKEREKEGEKERERTGLVQ